MEKAIEDHAYEILDRMLAGIGYEYKLERKVEEEQIYFQIESPEAGRLIGRRAQMMQALQFLLNRMVRRISKDAPKCIVDVERYRERRRNELVEEALETAEKVKESGESSRLKPMNSFDRRAIHKALAEDDEVETKSVEAKGTDWKSIVISPVITEREEEEEEGEYYEDDYDDYDDYEEEGEEDPDEEQPKENTL